MAKKVMKNEIKSMPMERPIGVTILAVLGYIGAVATLLMGLAMIFFSAAFSSALTNLPNFEEVTMGIIGASFFIIMGIIFLPLAVLDFFIARGLWNGRNWARIFMIVLNGLSAVSAIVSLNIFSLAISGVIVWYLGFYKPAIAYFK